MILRILRNRLQIVISVFFATVLLAASVEFGCGKGFHSGGVGSCSGCHSTHSPQTSGQLLLLSSDSSSTCLNCHAASGGANSPAVFSPDGSALTPGGDFYWLTKSFSWLGGESPGYSHGHNIVAADFNLLPDPVQAFAPGGSFPAAKLGCTSCHDPHGQVAGGTASGQLPVSKPGSYGAGNNAGTISGNYRFLGDADYITHGYAFNSDAPVARQSSVNKYVETDSSHVDYGSGMSEWCGNCHGGILNSDHEAGGGAFEHPSGDGELLEQEILTMYNSYVKSGDLSGIAATSYLQFVPFERGTNSLQFLDPNSTAGPDANSNVMCLSCHRAHASAFPHAGRWDFTATLLVNSHPAVGDIGATSNDVYYSYYGRDITTEFGSGQGQFCEKCHGADLP
jgi:predicted CXXCH cytochrome family protein